MFDFVNSFDHSFMQHFAAFLIGSVRIIALIRFAPVLGAQLTGPITLPLVLALYIPVHPYLLTLGGEINFQTTGDLFNIIMLVCKEAILGFLLAYVCAALFYVAMCAGIIIDNQRGASQAQTSEPFGGADSSPLGTALLLAMITLFFTSGAFMNFLAIFYSTYTFWSPFSLTPAFFYPNISIFVVQNVDFLMLHALLICAPFLLVALMCDIALGLINRFSPQLNVFILSMPIKSGVCSFLIIFYLGPFLNHSEDLFLYLEQQISLLRQIIGDF